MAWPASKARKQRWPATSSSSWTATAPTIRPPSRHWSRRSAPARYDFVIASRARGAREPGSMAWHQLVAGRIAGVLTRLLYGVRYTDMCAFRAIRRDTLLALGMRELTYGWNLEMQMRVARAGLRVLEVPVAYRRRLGGQSKVAGSLRGSVRAAVENHLDLRARGDGACARARFLARLHRHLAAAAFCGHAQLFRMALLGSIQNAQMAAPTTRRQAATMNGACHLSP